MTTNINKIMLTDTKVYISEIIALTNNNNYPKINDYPITNYLMVSAFLKMIGAIEQKLAHLKWYMGLYDFDTRREIAKDIEIQSTNIKVLLKSYKIFMDKLSDLNCNSLNLNPKSIWKNNEHQYKALREVIKLFRKSSIIHNTDSAYILFKQNNPLFFLKQLKRLEKKRNNQKNNQKNLNAEISYMHELYNDSWIRVKGKGTELKNCTDEKAAKFLEVCYENTMIYRHSIAHNILSAKSNLPTIEDLSSEKKTYENYYFRFFIIIYIDLIIQDIFRQYSGAKLVL